VILSVKARRGSKDVQDLPDGKGGGTNVLEFDVPYTGPAPTVIVDCGNKFAFGMFQVKGSALPSRACPIRPKGAPASAAGPPSDWIDKKGELKGAIFVDDKRPSDLFAVVTINTCNDCEQARGGQVGLKSDMDAIRTAFAQQLQVEDFTGFDLDDEDRDVRRWIVHWDDIGIISD